MLPPPHPSRPHAPLRARASSSSSSPSRAAHLRFRFRLPFLCSPYSSPLLRWPTPIRAHASGERGLGGRRGAFGPDALLSAAELLCLAPPAICSVVCAARLLFLPAGASAGPQQQLAGGRLLLLQYLLLVAAVAIGSLIRRRLRPAAGAAQVGAGLAGRVEKVEETVRGMVAAVAVLSRTVEKLGLRCRVLRRTLRDPISEIAALSQKNSEATRILAAQEDLLEKEISAIQKVLYAMQEQQQKQLELILAIGEASRILDAEPNFLDGDIARSSVSSPAPELEKKQVETESEAVTGGNNMP